jgi:hypothetical protein
LRQVAFATLSLLLVALLFKICNTIKFILRSSVARWSRPIATDERVEKAPFRLILAIVNVVEADNES